jgi:hypothetical protein
MANTKGWYKIADATGSYYTHAPTKKSNYIPVGDGNTDPTPSQIAQMGNQKPNGNLECFGKVMCEYDIALTTLDQIELPVGCYVFMPSSPMGGEPDRLVPVELREDKYLKMASHYDPLAEDIAAFLSKEDIYRKIGILYKRGALLYGPPGQGKTSLIRTLIQKEIPKDAVVVFLDCMPGHQILNTLKETLASRLKVFVFEEMANVIENARIERVLDFLDGEKSMDRSIIIATTNYPERLPGNIVDRPSRFDRVIKMGNPNKEERRLLLSHYLLRESTDAEVEATKDLSTAAIKEACILTHIRGLTVPQAAKALSDHSKLVQKDFSETRKVGLGRNYDED